MPDKTDEERERIAKKLAEQRAKIEGMPTTAKVRAAPGVISSVTLLSRTVCASFIHSLFPPSAQN